ncbi:MAG: uroporphyrinogen decarboxylase family protein [Promethearchaeota archaeon]
MNSRERLLTTLDHKEPDRVPIDFGGNQSGIHKIAYRNLVNYLGIEDPNPKYADFVQQLVDPCEEILERFHIDTRYIRPKHAMIKITDMEPEYVDKYVGVYDQFGVFWGNFADKPFESLLYFDPVIHPFKDFTSVSDIENHEWPKGNDPSNFEGLHNVAKELSKSPYGLVTPPCGCIFEYTTFLFGFVKAVTLLHKQPEMILTTMHHLLEYWKDYNTGLFKEIGDFVNVICVNGDLAEQRGPFFNPKTYMNSIVPIEKQLIDHIKKIAPVKINYHCCGSVSQLIEGFIECGYDAANPVQISANDMEPCSIKQRFGEKITFWGGMCDTQNMLPFGTPEKIREHVKRNFECLKPNGGYVAANIHNITAEVPPENIVAMFDAAYEFGKY